MDMMIIQTIVAFLVLILGVPTRFKYYWQGSKVARRRSARDVSRKFYLVSWVVYVLQVAHNAFRGDWVNVVFWAVGVFTVAYCIAQCYRFWHVKMSFWRWVFDSFQNPEEGGLFR
jgi:hypothetical protein